MSVHLVVGPLFSPHQIEEALIATLREWLPSYAAVAGEQHGLKLPPVKSWGLASEYDRWPEQSLPALIVACPGLRGNPDKSQGNGFYRATWGAEVSITVAHATAVGARKTAQIYAAAIRGTLLQRRSLGDGSRVTEWIDEAYGDVSTEQRRTVSAAANVFEVEQGEVVSWRKGPGSEKPPIPAAWPTAKEEPEVETEIE